jgi:hypothetical protein
MADKNTTLLFIPDISGFTQFVNNTEIKHSRHIISELLEIIIDSNSLDMQVSEIEGDAVLFYKESIPSVANLVEQCRKTFINFHHHLRRYDTERICRCGACETASKLTLKFIIHAGDVEKIAIKDQQKLHGASVIVAHRLLKNSIHINEYVLITDDIPLPEDSNIFSGDEELTGIKGSDSYDDQGEVGYRYISLSGLHNQLQELSPILFPDLSSEKISFENIINAPIDEIYENFTNFDKRLEWNEEIKDIIMHGKNLNKSGSLHTCLVGQNSLDIETIGRLEDKDKIIYGERLNKFKSLRDIITIYTFQKQGDQTKVIAEVDFKIKSLFSKLIKPMVKKMLKQQTENGLKKLKIVSEEYAG